MPVPVDKATVSNNSIDVLRKKYFAMCKQWGIPAGEAKLIAKGHYNVDSFTYLTAEQLQFLIDSIEKGTLK